MPRCSRWLVLLFVPLFFSLSHAQGRMDCDALESHTLGEPVHYCVMLPAGYDATTVSHSPRRYPVLYFLHGLGENEQTFFKSGGWNVIEDLHQQSQITDFLIIAPEGKSSFYINSSDGQVRYSDFFIGEFIPYIEAKYSIQRERAARAISGFSMGGFGALRFAFAHPELFSSVSAQSAALFAAPPQRLGRPLDRVFGDPIAMPHWNQNSPFVLAKQNRAQMAELSIYFNCGREDDFGFDKGAEELHRQLRKEGIKHEFHIYPGNHGTAYFQAHLAETLKFHSRLFARK